jgi:hypothetical protein
MAGTTTIMPADFVAKPAAEAYCMSGTVGKDAMSASVALLGFNIAQPAPASCAAGVAAAPGSVVPTADGLAVNFIKKGTNTAFTWRVQIQGPKGETDANDRWCATVTEVQGKVFVKWADFTPSCWAAAGMRGTPYAKQPLSAVVFTVPGNATAAVPYEVCVNGFTYGTSPADAPDGPAMVGDQVGTVGVAGTADNLGDFKRTKVVVGGKTGLLVMPGDIDGLVAALDPLMTNPILAVAMGELSRKRVVSEFSIDIEAQKIAAVYKAVLQ